MHIHVHALCWNERTMLPYFLAHYRRFAERIFLWDNESTDGSREWARQFPAVTVRTFPGAEINEDRYIAVKREAADLSLSLGADWTIVVDCDELLYHPRLVDVLAGYMAAGVEVPQVRGYQYVWPEMPPTAGFDVGTMTHGSPAWGYGKFCCFRSYCDVPMAPGCHETDEIKAEVFRRFKSTETPELALWHVKWLSVDYVLRRHALLRTRAAANIARGYGIQYGFPEERTRADAAAIMANLQPVIYA